MPRRFASMLRSVIFQCYKPKEEDGAQKIAGAFDVNVRFSHGVNQLSFQVTFRFSNVLELRDSIGCTVSQSGSWQRHFYVEIGGVSKVITSSCDIHKDTCP